MIWWKRSPRTYWRHLPNDTRRGKVGRGLAAFGFRGWAWVSAVAGIAAITALGAAGYAAMGEGWPASLYRALQLFGLNFAEPGRCVPGGSCDLNWQIEWARFLAPLVLIAAIIKLLADGIGAWVQREAHTRFNTRPRDIVLGFGPVGRAVGERLLKMGRAVTWIDAVADDAAARREAELMGGLLVPRDPSSERAFAKALADRAARVFVALGSDAASLDAAEALRVWRGASHKGPIRLFARDPEFAARLPQAARQAYVSGRGIASVVNLHAEAARRLVLRARWDRTALLLGQERVHLVIAGFGAQGQALLEETLMLCLRADLAPPLVTVLDTDRDGARARLARRSPTLLDPGFTRAVEGWLPPHFVACDLETVDFGALDLAEGGPPVAVTAWAICSGDDDLNLRASLALLAAMQTRAIPGAPIHARVWAGHQGECHQLGQDELTQVNIFGSLSDALDMTSALDEDPDRISKALHRAYRSAEKARIGTDPGPLDSQMAAKEWDSLSASKQESNRRAHRHAPFKLADLGIDWRAGEALALPRVEKNATDRWKAVEKRLRDQGFAAAQDDDETRFLRTMQVEHDRWCIDRAVDGWRLPPADTPKLRDEARLIHPDMTRWDNLKSFTRGYDGFLLCGLLENDLGSADVTQPPATAHKRVSVALVHGQPLMASETVSAWRTATEIVVTLPTGELLRPEKTKLRLDAEPVRHLLNGLKAACARTDKHKKSHAPNPDHVCRLVLVFPSPPTPPVLHLANELGKLAWGSGFDVQALWAWQGTDARAPAGLPEADQRLSVLPLHAPSHGDRFVLAFAGHRVLTNADQARTDIAAALAPMLALEAKDRPVLLSGYAEGADRLAVELWRAGNGEVRILLPWRDPVTPKTHGWTDDPQTADPARCRIDLAAHGIAARDDLFAPEPSKEEREAGVTRHVTLARQLVTESDQLVAAWNGQPTRGPGGTGDVVALARSQGLPTIIVPCGSA